MASAMWRMSGVNGPETLGDMCLGAGGGGRSSATPMTCRRLDELIMDLQAIPISVGV